MTPIEWTRTILWLCLSAVGVFIIGYNYLYSLIGRKGKHTSPGVLLGGLFAFTGIAKATAWPWAWIFLLIDYTIPLMIFGVIFGALSELIYKSKSKVIYRHPKSEDSFLKDGYRVNSLAHDEPLQIETIDQQKFLVSQTFAYLKVPFPKDLDFTPTDYKKMVIVYGDDKNNGIVLISLKGIPNPQAKS